MDFAQTFILGAVSGLTIFLGLPLARLKTEVKKHLSFLNALAIGILFFLYFDIMKNASEPIEAAIRNHNGSVWLLISMMIAGFGVGLLSLVYYGKRFLAKGGIPSRKLALLIAISIGLHNFSEGLAIGNSAHVGEIHLAFMLIIGFGLHNITEAFGIAIPLSSQKVRWTYIAFLGLIAGIPSLFGTIVGFIFISQPMVILFLSLAGGAIMYVIGELLAAGRKIGFHEWGGWGLAIGFFIGLLTDFILVAAGT